MLSLRTRRFREAEHRAALVDGAFGEAWVRALSEAEAKGANLGAILRGYLREALERDQSPEPNPAGAYPLVETEDNPESGNRRLKTDNAERVIPLHPEVIRLGFLEYVARAAPNPNDPLFPDLKPQGKDRKRGPRITRWFVEYRRGIKLFRPGVSMHAFRHTANTRLRDAIQGFQQERHVAYLLGHSQGGGEGRERYDKGPGLKAVAETLALLRYPEVNLSRLYVDQQGTRGEAA